MKVRTGIGQDSHRFLKNDTRKPLVIAGITFEGETGVAANSDGDVVFHALCNAITSLTHTLIMGGVADEMCLQNGIIDSEMYLKEAIKSLGEQTISHVAITIEGRKPKLKEKFAEMRANIARVLHVDIDQVGLTATSGEGLTDFGCGNGLQCFAIVTTQENT